MQQGLLVLADDVARWVELATSPMVPPAGLRSKVSCSTCSTPHQLKLLLAHGWPPHSRSRSLKFQSVGDSQLTTASWQRLLDRSILIGSMCMSDFVL